MTKGHRSKIHPTPMKRHALTHVLLLGLIGGVLIAILRWSEYQFLVIEHSLEIYGAIVAIIFVVFGIWLGIKLTKPREKIILREVLIPSAAEPAAPATFTLNQPKLDALGITPRELEILTLIAQGLSNREIATRLFVSENTVKTHCSRAFDKLGARRRTQAVQLGKQLGLLP